MYIIIACSLIMVIVLCVIAAHTTFPHKAKHPPDTKEEKTGLSSLPSEDNSYADVLDYMAELIADAIQRNPHTTEAETEDYTVTFEDTLETSTETVYTGVEFLGCRESYQEERKTLTSLKITGIYDNEGESISMPQNLNPEKLMEKINTILQE